MLVATVLKHVGESYFSGRVECVFRVRFGTSHYTNADWWAKVRYKTASHRKLGRLVKWALQLWPPKKIRKVGAAA